MPQNRGFWPLGGAPWGGPKKGLFGGLPQGGLPPVSKTDFCLFWAFHRIASNGHRYLETLFLGVFGASPREGPKCPKIGVFGPLGGAPWGGPKKGPFWGSPGALPGAPGTRPGSPLWGPLGPWGQVSPWDPAQVPQGPPKGGPGGLQDEDFEGEAL